MVIKDREMFLVENTKRSRKGPQESCSFVLMGAKGGPTDAREEIKGSGRYDGLLEGGRGADKLSRTKRFFVIVRSAGRRELGKANRDKSGGKSTDLRTKC